MCHLAQLKIPIVSRNQNKVFKNFFTYYVIEKIKNQLQMIPQMYLVRCMNLVDTDKTLFYFLWRQQHKGLSVNNLAQTQILLHV